MYPGAFWPKGTGADFELTPLLKPLADLRGDFTLFSHLDHGLKGGHFAVHTFLTGVKAADARGMPEAGISVDQRAAELVGAKTRFPSLTVGSEDGLHGGPRMSWTRGGTRVPPIPGPRGLFRALFVDDDAGQKRQASDRLALHGSILDAVRGDTDSLKKRLNKPDNVKLDEYLSAVRDVEKRIDLQRHWQGKPKPKPGDMTEPVDQGLARDLPAIYDLLALALRTDSTRVATLELGGSFVAADLGVRRGYHSLSHHGHVAENIELLVQLELYQMEQFARFVRLLKETKQPGSDESLLQSTTVLMGSGMGNGNSHTNNDLPVILAGGGFRHEGHKAHPAEGDRRVPLSKLFVNMLQRFGVETDRFGTVTGTLPGLETA